MEFKNLKELKEAFDSGRLDKKMTYINLDNDSCWAGTLEKTGPNEVDWNGERLYETTPQKLLEEALELLNIPAYPV